MIKNRVATTVKIGEGDEAKEIEIYVKRPTNDIIRKADIFRTKTWSDCAAQGIQTKKEVVKMMEERGIWSKEKDEEEEKISKKILELERTLYHGDGKTKPKLSEGRDLAIQIRRERIKLRELISERIGLEENCAENLADNARFDFLVANCTYYKDGSKVYSDFDDYNSKSADEIAFAAASTLGEMMYNLNSNFEKNLPENKFLTKFGLVNDELSLIDPNEGYTIDTEGRRIDEEGYYVNDEGHRVDKEGNLLTEDGGYELTEYENDLVIAKPKAKRTTKKTTKTEEAADS